MNYLDKAKRVQVVKLLVEGMSLRAIARVTGVSKVTTLKLLASLGEVCSDYQDRHLRNLPCRRIEFDEIWAFVGAKEKNATLDQKAEGWGDIWTWTAFCPDTKLMVSWYVGNRDFKCAKVVVNDLKDRLANRVQLTTDGHKPYLQAVEEAFGGAIDYAVLIKLYGNEGGREAPANVKYSPADVTGVRIEKISGRPDPKFVSTSGVERQNLTMRMSMRRFTRLTNGFSKKAENHAHQVALHFMHYNFCRIHTSIRVTPAMEAGVANHVWDVEEIIALVDAADKAREAALGPRRTRGKSNG